MEGKENGKQLRDSNLVGAQGVKVTKNCCTFHLRKSQKNSSRQVKIVEDIATVSKMIQQRHTKQYK